MPFYYTVVRETTTNGTTQTLSTHLRGVTIANQETVSIVGLYGAGRHGTAGGGYVFLVRPGAAGSGGTAQTPSESNPNTPAAQSTWTDDTTAITPGATPVTVVIAGIAQTGGQGGWVALEKDMGKKMLPGAVATTSHMEVGSKAVGTSVPIVVSLDFCEG
jgi:hypothetical protein